MTLLTIALLAGSGEPPPWWTAYSTILLSACLGFISALYFGRRKDKREDAARREAEEEAARIRHDKTAEADREWKAGIEKQLAVFNAQISPLWLVAQQKLSADLHHNGDRYKAMDALLEELDDGTIDDFPGHRVELERLLVLRAHDYHEDITADQRDSALALPVIMRKVKLEAETPGPLTQVGLVGVKESSLGEGENMDRPLP